MAELVIQTRVTPPRNPVNIIRRERLSNLMRENLDKSLILICGPAGYGKTTLVSDFLSDKREFAWFSASKDINNPYTFFYYLTYALKRINKEFGASTLQIIDTVKQEERRFQNLSDAIEEIAGTFINDCQQHFTSEIYFVIDDLHNINNSEWLRTSFNKLFENMPQNFHLIITSRVIPEFNLPKLSARRSLFQIKSNDLNFTIEEITNLLKNIYSLNYSDDDIKFLGNKLGGWITGIHLIIQAYGGHFNKAKFQPDDVPENIFDFFANEIFENLENSAREFLLNTALLESLDPLVCDHILGITTSRKMINELLNKNIFIQPINLDDNPPQNTSTVKHYSYQDLFRKFLVSKLGELKSKEEVNSLLKKFHRYYLDINDIESAINYGLLAGEYKLAVPLIVKHFQKYFDEGKFENLWKWFDALPNNTEIEMPKLLLYKSKLFKFYLGDLEKALQYIEKAIEQIEEQNEKELTIDCYIAKADILLDFGKNKEVIQDLSKLAEVQTTPENRAKILYTLGYSHFMNSDYNKSLDFLNKALEICSEHDFKEIQLDIFTVMGYIYINRGEYIKGTFYYEKIVERSNNLFKKFVSLCNLVLVCSRSGKYEKARDYIAAAEELFRRFTTPIFEGAFLLANLSLRYDVGDFEESLELLEKINTIARKLDRKGLTYLSYELMAETYYYLGKPAKSSEYLDLSKKYFDEHNKFDMLHHSCSEAMLRKKARQLEGVDKILIEAYSFYKDNMFEENRVKMGFHLADYYQLANMPETALQYLREALTIGVEKEYISFFERQVLDSRNLFDLAIENKIEKAFIKAIIESLIDRKNYEWLSDECRQRISRKTEELYDIKMVCFGGLEFKVRGRNIPEEKWIRKKRKLILAYLLLNPNVTLTKDKIINMFYPDTPLDTADNIFHQTISNIRGALKFKTDELVKNTKEKKGSGKDKKEKQTAFSPQLILYEDKVLKLNPDYIYMADVLEFNQLYNSFKVTGISIEKKIDFGKKAFELYKGELLAGYYDQWCEDLRQDYLNKFIRLSEDLIEYLKSRENLEEVILYSDKLLKADKLNEKAYLNIIESNVKMNNASRAKERFSQMLRTFESELGETPAIETMERVKKILP
jgi:DNA-binding SARP family transcriptional activator